MSNFPFAMHELRDGNGSALGTDPDPNVTAPPDARIVELPTVPDHAANAFTAFALDGTTPARTASTAMEKMDARHLDWGTSFLWVCFNNDCGFFKKGWEHMMNTVGQLVSYRFMITPDNGTQGVIPAFSHEYLQKQGKPSNPYMDPDAVNKYYEVPDED